MVLLTQPINRYLKTQEGAIDLSSVEALWNFCKIARVSTTPMGQKNSGVRLRTYLRSFIGIMVP